MDEWNIAGVLNKEATNIQKIERKSIFFYIVACCCLILFIYNIIKSELLPFHIDVFFYNILERIFVEYELNR